MATGKEKVLGEPGGKKMRAKARRDGRRGKKFKVMEKIRKRRGHN